MKTLIRSADTDAEIDACHAVMAELRPDVPRDGFVARIRRMQGEGYRLTYFAAGDRVVAVAGWRVLDQLAVGRVLYVDDLVTAERERSQGYGEGLLQWLHDQARTLDCLHLELDSAVWRSAAHRFYFRHGLSIAAYHFRTHPLR